MTILLADVGGTNARLAQADRPGATPRAVRSFANRDFADFAAVIAAYVAAEGLRDCRGCVVAMAGPVAAGQGRLTNLGWEMSEAALRAATGCDQAWLMNDLTALGHALPLLPEQAIRRLAPPRSDMQRNGQALVVGIGTGFNVCPSKAAADGTVDCLAAEAGHVQLPPGVRATLQEAIADRAGNFVTVEDLFSGRGLSAFDAALHQGEARPARAVVEAHAKDAAGQTLALYGRMLGQLCHELALHHMPGDGIYFAGSVARGLLGAGITPRLSDHSGPDPFADRLARIPLSVILDDAAALYGCSGAAARLSAAGAP